MTEPEPQDQISSKLLILMVGERGFEPPTLVPNHENRTLSALLASLRGKKATISADLSRS
jgi:hypothetical protein